MQPPVTLLATLAKSMRSLALIALLAPFAILPMNAESTAARLQASMIWSPAAPSGSQAYVAFRKCFDLPTTPSTANFHLFADSRYLLWVNGKQLLRGPCRFNPKRPEFDFIDLAPHLHKGRNSIVVLVHHYPAVSGRIMRHEPGLTALLEIDGTEFLRSDTSWRSSADTEYRPSPGAWSSIPDVIDARLSPGDWTSPAFDDSAWQAATPIDGNIWGTMHARSIPLPRESELLDVQLKPGEQPIAERLPIELSTTDTRPWSYPGGFMGKWMWTPGAAKRVWFKTIWSNAGFGVGQGCDLKVLCDNRFTLYLNDRPIATSDDVATGWTGKLDVADGDVITIEAEDLEQGDRSAGLFVSMLNGGNAVLGTADFLATSTPPPSDWKTSAELSGFSPLSPTNVHPAHIGPAAGTQSLVLDLRRMAMAYPTIELEADEGSVLQLQYALRHVNGEPAETYGVGTTYTARAGRQSFVAADQWCARYVTVSCLAGRVKILGLKMIDRRYPFERVGSFKSNDPFLDQLWEMSVNTIECTSDDAYGSDARERNEWVQDAAKASFNTTRIATSGPGEDGTKIPSDPRLLQNVLRHAALSQIDDGSLLGTFPTDRGREDPHYVIEDYNCQWVEALRTYLDATGDEAFIREMWPHLLKLMDGFHKQVTPRGLLLAREYTSFDNPLAYITCEGANINAFFHQALRDSAKLATEIGEIDQARTYETAAATLHDAFNQHFWLPDEGAYRAGILSDQALAPTAHAQLLALHCGLVPDKRKDSTRRWFLANYKNPSGFHCGSNPDSAQMIADKSGIGMPIMFHWVFHELYRMDSETSDREVLDQMRSRWRYMVELQQDAGTLSEKFVHADGSGASESCHNYGSIPAHFLSSYVLGVRRLLPVAEKQLRIEPRLGDLTHAEGTVVTEFGPIPVAWRREADQLEFTLELPPGIDTVLRIPDAISSSLVLDDCQVQPAKEGRHLVIALPGGRYTGRVNLR